MSIDPTAGTESGTTAAGRREHAGFSGAEGEGLSPHLNVAPPAGAAIRLSLAVCSKPPGHGNVLGHLNVPQAIITLSIEGGDVVLFV